MKQEEFFKTLYDKTYHFVLRYVILKCDTLSNVEDIVQNVYLKTYEQILKKGEDYFKNPLPLLIKFCKNELFYYYSLKNKFKMIFLKNNDDNILDSIPAKENVEEKVIANTTIEKVWEIISKENLITQKIVTLYFLEGLSLQEISIILGLNINTIKSKLYRLTKEIQKKRCYNE